jgi:putative ABC transport system ATP-binding protein
MIKLENISKVYRTKEIETLALDNINFEVKEGEFVSVMGPSGCGKSTLLNIIGLLDEPDNGRLNLNTLMNNSFSTMRIRKLPR